MPPTRNKNGKLPIPKTLKVKGIRTGSAKFKAIRTFLEFAFRDGEVFVSDQPDVPYAPGKWVSMQSDAPKVVSPRHHVQKPSNLTL